MDYRQYLKDQFEIGRAKGQRDKEKVVKFVRGDDKMNKANQFYFGGFISIVIGLFFMTTRTAFENHETIFGAGVGTGVFVTFGAVLIAFGIIEGESK